VLRNYSLAVKVSNFNNLSSFNLPRLKNKKNEKGRLEKQRLMHLKSKALRCRDCLECISGTFMCLQCPHVGCWEKNHFVNHAKKQGHIFGK
jgi:ubiquitin carboxyl-terminal hydrolase 22/27/51